MEPRGAPLRSITSENEAPARPRSLSRETAASTIRSRGVRSWPLGFAGVLFLPGVLFLLPGICLSELDYDTHHSVLRRHYDKRHRNKESPHADDRHRSARR